MARLAHLAKGIAALAVLAVLVAGIPWALWHYIGWPLPHHMPSVAQVGHALDAHGIAGRTLVDVLAVVVWVTWAVLVASVAAEIPAALAGQRARRLPVAGVFQPLTGRLVAAVVVAALALAPRPAQSQPVGSPGTGLVALRHPVAALVLAGNSLPTKLHAPPTAPPGADTSPTGAPVAPPPAAGPPGPAPHASPGTQAAAQMRTYVVGRGDTLWGIAERELGDPLRWSQIYALNEGRPQPGGATLTDPHWIDPGWTLLLPASTPAPTPPATPIPIPPTDNATAPTSSPSRASTSPAAPGTPAPTSSAPSAAPAPRHPEPAVVGRGTEPVRGEPVGAPVQLPSGSVVAGSFAAGVLSAVALGRLRRRHSYRYHPPQPGRNLTPPPPLPTLAHLTRAAHADDDDEEAPLAATVREGRDGAVTASISSNGVARGASGLCGPGSSLDDAERRQDPGRLEVAILGGRSVACDITDLSGVALCGPVADDVARALLAGLVVRAGPGAAEVLCTDVLAGRLLPRLGPLPAIRQVQTPEDLARAVEAARIARTRRLEGAGTPDAKRFRAEHPENPLPLLLVLADAPSDATAGRWAALRAGAPPLGIAVIFLSDTPAASGRVVLDDTRAVTGAEPAALADRFRGAELFGLRADEAVELLGVLADAAGAGSDSEQTGAGEHAGVGDHGDGAGGAASSPHGSELVWPEPAPGDDAGAQAARPIRVEVLGAMQIAAFGQPVATGVRSRAKALLAWYVCRPEGASAEQAVDALWPDTPPEAVLRQFWRALGDLRAGLRGPGGETPEVLEKTGERYRPAPGEIACDLWELQAALGAAARAEGDDAAREALRRAVEVYRADLLDGTGDPWVEPVRQDLHRRALDAHLRLAELEEAAGRPDAAVATLEQTIELDRYAEEPYRRLMTLHAARGRLDAVGSTWRQLNLRLAELDLDVEPASARLYRT
ncbi:MAG: BTAD domain-containing putative transcriptional regulator, partial [Acidimicrobiales bacterium]